MYTSWPYVAALDTFKPRRKSLLRRYQNKFTENRKEIIASSKLTKREISIFPIDFA